MGRNASRKKLDFGEISPSLVCPWLVIPPEREIKYSISIRIK